MDILGCVPKLRGDIVLSEEDEGYLLYNPLTDNLHSVSKEARLLLQKFDGTRNVESAIHEFLAGQEVQEQEKAKWLSILLVKDLLDRNILEM